MVRGELNASPFHLILNSQLHLTCILMPGTGYNKNEIVPDW